MLLYLIHSNFLDLINKNRFLRNILEIKHHFKYSYYVVMKILFLKTILFLIIIGLVIFMMVFLLSILIL